MTSHEWVSKEPPDPKRQYFWIPGWKCQICGQIRHDINKPSPFPIREIETFIQCRYSILPLWKEPIGISCDDFLVYKIMSS